MCFLSSAELCKHQGGERRPESSEVSEEQPAVNQFQLVLQQILDEFPQPFDLEAAAAK